jgi:hypothetical protein
MEIIERHSVQPLGMREGGVVHNNVLLKTPVMRMDEMEMYQNISLQLKQ